MKSRRYVRGWMILSLLVGLIAMLFAACGKRTDLQNQLISGTPHSGGEITATPTPTDIVASQRITWALPRLYAPSVEERREINRLLNEKGLDCVIDFVETGVFDNPETEEWIICREQEGTVPDVLCSGVWPSLADVSGFLQKHFYDYSSYMETEEGKKLYKAFSEGEWATVIVDGQAFVIPRLINAKIYNCGTYVSVREEYASSLMDFDGTYGSLKQLLKSTGRNDLCISFEQISESVMFGLLGYCTYAGLPYDLQKRKLIDVTVDKTIGEQINQVFYDLKNTETVKSSLLSEIPDDEVFAKIYTGKRGSDSGFVEICIAPDLYELRMNMTYGISKESKQKELAFRILCACYEDPRIAALIKPGMESGEAVEKGRTLLKDEKPSELKGFRPVQSDIITRGRGICSDTSNAISRMFRSENNKLVLVDSCDAVAMLKGWRTVEKSELVEELNRQIAEYCTKQEK